MGLVLILTLVLSFASISRAQKSEAQSQALASESKADFYKETLKTFEDGKEKLTVLGIGKLSRDSVLNWMTLFNNVKDLQFVGLVNDTHTTPLDINEGSIHFEIGLPSSNAVLDSLCSKYGPFDIIFHSGDSESSVETTLATLERLFPCMKDSAYYFIENPVHMSLTENIMEVDMTVNLYISRVHIAMHHWWTENQGFFAETYSGRVKSIQLADSVVALERGVSAPYTEVMRGNVRIPYQSNVMVKYLLNDGRLLELYQNVGENSSLIPHAELNRFCHEMCSGYEGFEAGFTSLEHCAFSLKEGIIRGGYFYYDDFMQNNEA